MWRKGVSMTEEKKEDLRVIKTRKAIRSVFEEMICEMNFEDITVKELTKRALINRKTFYLHYDSLDDLLEELQDEIVEHFVSQDVSYRSMEDIKRSIRFFFKQAEKMPKLSERLLTSGSYSYIGDRINARIMEYRARQYRGAFSRNIYEDNLVFAYFASNSIILYRQWVKDGKIMTIDDLIVTATKLICSGLSAYVKQ